ncbi:NAD-dependent epimerase/dehydratase family protein, partial [Candidatus Curtissbacteria bacterium]|nr:NAD-dependent epimerase/dehydratase family protein [Candidatus Curtissbacteria bacterium]
MGLAGKNILVTGGFGFYGSHLAAALLEKDANVFVVDVQFNPKSYFFDKELDKKIVYEIFDITDFFRTHAFITKNSIDFVFHTAALATVEASL